MSDSSRAPCGRALRGRGSLQRGHAAPVPLGRLTTRAGRRGGELQRIREALAIDESGLADLCSWFGKALDDEDHGRPNVLTSLRAAAEFRDGSSARCTFSCDLERDFHGKLGISTNEHGLIDKHLSTVAAGECVNRDDGSAEPVPWYPFRVGNCSGVE